MGWGESHGTVIRCGSALIVLYTLDTANEIPLSYDLNADVHHGRSTVSAKKYTIV